MNNKEIKELIRTVSEIRFLTFLFLAISFLPLEATCVPGNIMLILSPFVILLIRYRFAGKISREDLMYAGVFVVAILFVTGLAWLTNCVKTYGVAQELPHEWKFAQIESISPDGIVSIKVIRTIPIQLNEIKVFVDGTPRRCQWQTTFPNFIAPGQIKACDADIVCTGSTTVEIVTPGNNDTAVC